MGLGLTCVRAFGTISRGVLDKVEAEIIGGVVHLPGMAVMVVVVLPLAAIGGMAVLPLAEMVGMAVPPLVETTEVGEEGARLHAALGTLQSPDGRTLQRGQTDLVRVQAHATIPTVTKVRLIRAMDFAIRPSILCPSFS